MHSRSRSNAKKPKYFIFPMGEGRYRATWQEKDVIHEMIFNDKKEMEKHRAMKNPYKSGLFPYVYIEFEKPRREAKRSGARKDV